MSAEPQRTSPLAAILLGGLLIIAGGITAWNMLGSEPEGEPGEPVATDTGPESGPAGKLEGAAQKQTAAEAAARKTGGTTATRQPVVPKADAIPGSPRPVKFTFKIKGTDAPASHARVLYPTARPVPPAQQSNAHKIASRRLAYDHELWFERFGTSTKADQDGVVYLQIPKKTRGGWQVLGRLGELFGKTWVRCAADPPDGGYVVFLEKDLGFYVQTVDAQRRPVPGVPLALRYMQYQKANDQDYEGVAPVGLTDSRGRLHIRHMQSALVATKSQDGKTPFRVCLNILGHHREGVDLTLDRLPERPVELIVPPTGRVEVRVVDRLGKPVPDFREINLFLEGKTRYFVDTSNVRRPPATWKEFYLPDKPAVFRYVGLGLPLEAFVGSFTKRIKEIFTGPERAGETVKVTVTLKGSGPMLVGRALDRNGNPLAQRKLKLFIFLQDKAMPTGATGTTDQAGKFQIQIPQRVGAVLPPVTKVRFDLLDKKQRPVGIGAQKPVAAAVGQGQKIDLGDVLLQETPLLLAGQLVGKGDLSEHTVRMSVQRTNAASMKPGVIRWERGATIVRKKDHSFEIRGFPATHQLELMVFSDAHLPVKSIPFVPGDKDVVVRLEQGGSAKATLHWGNPEGNWGLSARLVPVDVRLLQSAQKMIGAGYALQGVRTLDKDQGSYEDKYYLMSWRATWPGTYRLEVRLFGEKTPVHTVDNVVIREGEETHDERLKLIDLTNKVLRLVLHCRGPDGRPPDRVAGMGLAVRLRGGKATGEAFAIYNGRCSLACVGSSIDVRILVPGYRPQTLRDIRKDTKVSLQPGPAVRIRLKTMHPKLRRGRVVALGLVDDRNKWIGKPNAPLLDPSAGMPRVFDGKLRYVAISTTGTFELAVPGPGRYRVRLFVRDRPQGTWDTRASGAPVRDVTPAEIVVKESSTEQVFEIQVPATSWQKAGVGRAR